GRSPQQVQGQGGLRNRGTLEFRCPPVHNLQWREQGVIYSMSKINNKDKNGFVILKNMFVILT
ncbi:MAG: hypothetical protein AAGJ80_11025, partial [Cyanobacteria bacterium J06553_1]